MWCVWCWCCGEVWRWWVMLRFGSGVCATRADFTKSWNRWCMIEDVVVWDWFDFMFVGWWILNCFLVCGWCWLVCMCVFSLCVWRRIRRSFWRRWIRCWCWLCLWLCNDFYLIWWWLGCFFWCWWCLSLWVLFCEFFWWGWRWIFRVCREWVWWVCLKLCLVLIWYLCLWFFVLGCCWCWCVLVLLCMVVRSCFWCNCLRKSFRSRARVAYRARR